MKLISLNIWGGKNRDALLEFIRNAADDVQVFCFQEVLFGSRPGVLQSGAHLDIANQIARCLPHHGLYGAFAPPGTRFGKEDIGDVLGGTAIFVHRSLSVFTSGDFITAPPWGGQQSLTGRFQYVAVGEGKELYIVGNLHGVWQEGGKGDTEERFHQARVIRTFFDCQKGKKILCGDFNLSPTAKSLEVFGDGMRDLIKEHKIATTRNRFYENMEKYKDYISDYAFVSPDITVKQFSVIQNEVSDHLPLVLEYF